MRHFSSILIAGFVAVALGPFGSQDTRAQSPKLGPNPDGGGTACTASGSALAFIGQDSMGNVSGWGKAKVICSALGDAGCTTTLYVALDPPGTGADVTNQTVINTNCNVTETVWGHETDVACVTSPSGLYALTASLYYAATVLDSATVTLNK